jgi:5-methyltetrahydrofolate--homocysteine methyltransferase
MTTREKLDCIAKERVLILDGAMGSMILALNLSENDYRGGRFANHPTPLEGCNDLLCITKPEAIGAIHDAYLEAGADIIETCSFNSTSISLCDYGIGGMAYEISVEAAKIARKSADKFSGSGRPRFVAGSIGPTAKGASLYPDINDPSRRGIVWDELEAAYYDNARGLWDGGADILLVETIFDTLNAKAALFAVSRLLEERQADVPVMVSATVSDESGRLLSGQNLEAFVVSVLHAKPWAVGLNCSFGAKKLTPFIRRLSRAVPCLVSAYPNAGFPNQSGHYDETAEIMSANIEDYLKEGLINIIGGCCGSTPSHIAAIAKTARDYKPRDLPDVTRHGFFSGLEPLYVSDNTVHVKDTVNADNRKEFLQSLEEGEYEEAVDIARDMVESGTVIIDIETDDENVMCKFLDFALMNPYVAKAPFFINSPRFDVLEIGLKRLQGRGLAGPVSLEDGEAEFLRKAELIRRYGAAALITPVDEQGHAETDERKIEIVRRVYFLLKNSGYPLENIVFDLLTKENDDSIFSRIRENCPEILFAL